MPDILPANMDIVNLLAVCDNRWEQGKMDWQEIVMVADRLGIVVDEVFFRKLRAYELAAIQSMKREKRG